MNEKSHVRRTVDALSSAGLVIRGRLFESDSEYVTVDADDAHYDVLLEYVTNAAELANVKRGEMVEVKVSPDAKIVEKRLIEPNLPGIITDRNFERLSDDGYYVGDTSDCFECSYCSICRECSYCSICRPPIMYHDGFTRGSFARPRSVQ